MKSGKQHNCEATHMFLPCVAKKYEQMISNLQEQNLEAMRMLAELRMATFAVNAAQLAIPGQEVRFRNHILNNCASPKAEDEGPIAGLSIPKKKNTGQLMSQLWPNQSTLSEPRMIP